MWGWGAAARGLAPAVSYVNHGGFPRTWYSGNLCRGRASQLRTGAHILATGIPEVHRHLISSGSRATPMHPCCPHPVASEWLDPGLMVSLFSGGFWVTYLLGIGGCLSSSDGSRSTVVWLHGGMCYRLRWQAEGMFCCFRPQKGHKLPVMSSVEYLRVSTSSCGLLFVTTLNITIGNDRKCGLREFSSECVSVHVGRQWL